MDSIDPSLFEGPATKKRKMCAQTDLVVTAPVCDDQESFSSSLEEHSASTTAVTTPLTTPSTPRLRHPSDINKIFTCTFESCTKAFNRPAKLDQHLRSHLGVRPFVCTHALSEAGAACGKTFLRASHLQHHVKSVHTCERNYPCPIDSCDKAFLTNQRLRRHIDAHEGREKFHCDEAGCVEVFRKRGTLQAHILRVHQGIKPFSCGFMLEDGKRCNRGFDTKGKLSDHEGRCHSIKRFICTQCNAAAQPALEEHMKVLPHDLDTVDTVAFTTFSALQAHLTERHPPICGFCHLKCSTQQNLKSHIEVRHGDLSIDQRRTIPCVHSGCAAKFTKRGNLKVHLETVHGKLRFVCSSDSFPIEFDGRPWNGQEACGAQFTSKARLVDHVGRMHLASTGASKSPMNLSNNPPKTRVKKQSRKEKKGKVSTLSRLIGDFDGDLQNSEPGSSPLTAAGHCLGDEFLGNDYNFTTNDDMHFGDTSMWTAADERALEEREMIRLIYEVNDCDDGEQGK